MNLFPSQEIVSTTDTISTTTSTSSGKSPSFNFETGDFLVKDGKVQMVTGIEAVKLWIQKILKTKKNKYKIYNNNNTEKYGVELLSTITSKNALSYIEAQVVTIITNALSKNTDITSVTDFSFTRDKKLLNVTFTVNTVYGTSTESVVI
jgi:hypothetical protein